MKQLANQQSQLPDLRQDWEHLLVEQFQHPPGATNCHYRDEHSICLSLAPRPVRLLQIKGGRTHRGLYGKGDISITPAQMPFFVRWDGDDNYLQIRIASRFIQSVASQTLDLNPDRLELISEFRTRDRQIESIGLMLLAELQQDNLGGRLYIDSLANVLAIHLLRKYTTTKTDLPIYAGGLTDRQVRQILDYIDENLERDLKLADLATLLDLSQFHFSHLFKQSIGIAPYQYLLQQRIERAKRLLKQPDSRSATPTILDIALACGFSSHSHFSQQFRQLTGTTPTAYRLKSI
ncbi:AraC family transcriptional regulator [Chamaesiphon sp. VAR_48_metabat_403]|uniref:AraC family transcriptional regulator n=1 Tax=Chamaesiphon sp. VAR_48_metabat_403 TaxID=2964700 RepID=UPI00286DB5E4|nr:AraC family transcriptional regulator [Chamaesiphon sp. VAR_48_metabat_403]